MINRRKNILPYISAVIIAGLLIIAAGIALAGCDFIEDVYHPGARDEEPPREPVVSTLAGDIDGDADFADGTGTAAKFSGPWGVAADGNGNLYVADSFNHRIRKIEIASGKVTTLAGTATKNEDGVMIGGHADGTGTAAQFNRPYGIAVVGGDLYVADGLFYIRKIEIASGAVTTFAGDGSVPVLGKPSRDGTGTAAQFNEPRAIAVAGDYLYVAEYYSIRRIEIATGEVTTFAGSEQGFANGTGTAAKFSGLHGITVDGGNLYVTDSCRIRKIVIATGVVSHIAGAEPGFGFADGSAATAQFNILQGIVADGGNLYVADRVNNRIRKLELSSGEVTTYAGDGTAGDADGPLLAAQFDYPTHIEVDGGKFYVTDLKNNRIRVITP